MSKFRYKKPQKTTPTLRSVGVRFLSTMDISHSLYDYKCSNPDVKLGSIVLVKTVYGTSIAVVEEIHTTPSKIAGAEIIDIVSSDGPAFKAVRNRHKRQQLQAELKAKLAKIDKDLAMREYLKDAAIADLYQEIHDAQAFQNEYDEKYKVRNTL